MVFCKRMVLSSGAGLLLTLPGSLAAQLITVPQEPVVRADYPAVTPPIQCLAAVVRQHQLIWRKGERDTMPFGTPGDTFPSDVVRNARQCASKFSLKALASGQVVPGLTNRDLFPLVRLYLVAGWDDSVRTALDPLIVNSTMTTRDTFMRRDILLARIVEAHLGAFPARRDEAQRYADMVDALGAPAAVARLRAYGKLLNISHRMADTAGVRSAAERAFTAAADIPLADRGLVYDQIRAALYDAMGAADVTKDSALAEQTMVRLRDLLESLLAVNSRAPDSVRSYLSPQLPIVRGMLTAGYDQALGRTGHIPPVSAEHWFSEQGSSMAPPDSTKPTLVLRISPHRCNGIRCEKAYAALDRLAKQYQPRGVQIVLLVSTTGYLHFAVFDSVAAEVRAIRAYVQDTLRLPGILAVSESEFVQRQDRRIQQVVRGNEAYPANWFIVRDRMGGNRSRGLGFLSDQPDSEAWVRLALDLVLSDR